MGLYCVVLLSFLIMRVRTWKLWEILSHLKCLLPLPLFYGCGVFSYEGTFELVFLLWALWTLLSSRLSRFLVFCPQVHWCFLLLSLLLSVPTLKFQLMMQWPCFQLIFLSTSIVFLLRISVHLMKLFHPFFSQLVPDCSMKHFLLLSKSMDPHSQYRLDTMAWA